MIKEAIYELLEGRDLCYDMAKQVMEEMMDGTATQAQMGGFLTALRMWCMAHVLPRAAIMRTPIGRISWPIRA